MALRRIKNPVGEAVVRWHNLEEGRRRARLLDPAGFRAVAVFIMGDDLSIQPGWPWTADPMLSVFGDLITVQPDGAWLCLIDFPARHLAGPYIHVGQEFLVMGGAIIHAHATLTKVYPYSID